MCASDAENSSQPQLFCKHTNAPPAALHLSTDPQIDSSLKEKSDMTRAIATNDAAP